MSKAIDLLAAIVGDPVERIELAIMRMMPMKDGFLIAAVSAMHFVGRPQCLPSSCSAA